MNRTSAEIAVILAPHGRDAAIAETTLAEGGLNSTSAKNLPELVKRLRAGAGFAVIVEEAVRHGDLRPLVQFLNDQEEWSDFPFIVLTAKGGGLERNPEAVRLLETLGNVTFLERPFHPVSLVSLARSALRARRRQYEARARLESIREGQQRLEVALGAGGLGAWSIALDTQALGVSPESKAHYGLAPDAIVSLDGLVEAIHPDDRAMMLEAARSAIDLRQDYAAQYRAVWPDGSIHWVQANGRLEFGRDGKALRMVGVTQDITARRFNEQRHAALLELGDGLRSIEDTASMSLLASRILGETLQVSRAGYGMIDRERETITIAEDWNTPGTSSLAGTLQFRDYGSYIEDLKRGETVAIADSRFDPRTRDTSSALEAIDARAVLNMPVLDYGRFVALLYLNHKDAREWTASELEFVREVADRTQTAIERRQAEQALAELAASLEEKVEQRTRESEAVQEQLRQAQKMEAVGQLTGGLAHDFNNILGGISGGLELVETRLAQRRFDEITKYLDMAKAGAKRAAALTHRLLAFSRRQTLDPKLTDIATLTDNMAELLRKTVGPEIAVSIDHEATLGNALLDANQLENALLNLSINARDAMPEGGELRIRTRATTIPGERGAPQDLSPGEYLLLEVTDTGTGMSPETMSRVFDPFFTTKPIGQGTGLGLSMIYGFAKQSGGSVGLSSVLGEGTTVTLYLPRAGAAAVEDSVEDVEESRERPASSGETVLVVDDEPMIRMLVVDVLDELGYATLEAGDGAEGLATLSARRDVDLLITDVGLPNGMNGRQLADAARMDRPGLKVLFITGYADNAVLGGSHLEDGMAILTKPFQVGELAQRVRDLVDA